MDKNQFIAAIKSFFSDSVSSTIGNYSAGAKGLGLTDAGNWLDNITSKISGLFDQLLSAFGLSSPKTDDKSVVTTDDKNKQPTTDDKNKQIVQNDQNKGHGLPPGFTNKQPSNDKAKT